MAVRKTSMTLTADSGSPPVAVATAQLSPFINTRHGWVRAISWDDTQAFATQRSLAFFETADDGTAANPPTAATSVEANEIFIIDDVNLPAAQDGFPALIYPSAVQADQFGGAAQAQDFGGLFPIRRNFITARVDGVLTAGDVFTVVLYWESAGDTRF